MIQHGALERQPRPAKGCWQISKQGREGQGGDGALVVRSGGAMEVWVRCTGREGGNTHRQVREGEDINVRGKSDSGGKTGWDSHAKPKGKTVDLDEMHVFVVELIHERFVLVAMLLAMRPQQGPEWGGGGALHGIT